MATTATKTNMIVHLFSMPIRKFKLLSCVTLLLFLMVGYLACPAKATDDSAKTMLENMSSWGYQLQQIDTQSMAKGPHDLLVIDYSTDGSEDKILTSTQLSQLKVKSDGTKRIILAYLSIGEAENYRYYWKSNWKHTSPHWMGAQNEEWSGNFLVKYWEKDWQNIIYGNDQSYLSRIIAAGFDGVFLDRVDAYKNWVSRHKDAKQGMMDFVIKLSKYAKSKNSDFFVFVQNAEELFSSERYLNHIDGVAKEDLLFGAEKEAGNNSTELVKSHIEDLNHPNEHGLPVLVVEYLKRFPQKAKEATQRIRNLGYIPYIADRQLDTLHLPPP